MKKDAEENAAGSKADCELYLSRPVVQHWGDWNLLKEFRKLNPLTPMIKLSILNIVCHTFQNTLGYFHNCIGNTILISIFFNILGY